jgi:putative intracellular protease/amidase
LQTADTLVCAGLLANEAHRGKLENTLKLSSVSREGYVAAWLVGGYGAALEFGSDVDIPGIVGALWDAGGVVGAIGHGAHGLLQVKTLDGNWLIAGREVTGFSKAEDQAVERAVGSSFLPCYVEDELRARSAHYICTNPFQPFAIVSEDGRLVTGQQLFSGDVFGEKFTEALASI